MDLTKIIANSMYLMGAAFGVIIIASLYLWVRGRKQRRLAEERRRMQEQANQRQNQTHTMSFNSNASEFRNSRVVNPPSPKATTPAKPTSMADRLKVVNDKKR